MEHCEEKSRLAGEFTRAAEAYSDAAKALPASIHCDVTRVLDECERTRNECGKARRALQAHMLEHRC
jgi:hypothetical protein